MLWIWGLLVLAGVLFAAKMVYVVSTAMVLPYTQGALYVSTAGARIDAVLDVVHLASDQLMVDLGCGDGRVLRRAHGRYGMQAVGYELNPIAYLRARLGAMGKAHIRVVWADFWHADISRADLIFCYLFPDVLNRLAKKIRAEAKPGAQIVSCNFPLPGYTAYQVLHPVGSLHGDPIYLYRMQPRSGISR